MGPIDAVSGRPVEGGIDEQTRCVMTNLQALLDNEGLSFDDVLKVTVYLRDIERDFTSFDQVFREHFGGHAPARTTVGAQLPGILIEVDLVASYPQTNRSSANGGVKAQEDGQR